MKSLEQIRADEEALAMRKRERCRHKRTTGYMWRTTQAFLNPPIVSSTWFYAFVQPGDVKRHDSVTCDDCGHWLSLGPSCDGSPEVAVEIRAAELATVHTDMRFSLSTSVRFNAVEHAGWRGEETLDIVVERDGEREERNVGLNLDSDNWRAGLLARVIADHEEEP